jgi:hypothetical protein
MSRRVSVRAALRILPALLLAAAWLGGGLAGCKGGVVAEGRQGDGRFMETLVSPAEIELGQGFRVTCRLLDTQGRQYSSETAFDVVPPRFAMDGRWVVPTEVGRYEVACRTDDDNDPVIVDLTPPTVVVTEPTIRVVTELAEPEVPACVTTPVRCRVFDAAGAELALPTRVTVAPSDGITVTGHTLETRAPGEFRVTCRLADGPIADPNPPLLTVGASAPALVTTRLEPATVRPGETAQVVCEVWDTCGDSFDISTRVVADPGVTVSGHTVMSDESGRFTVTCLVLDDVKNPTETTPAMLDVWSGPVRVVLEANPQRNVYATNAQVTVTAKAYDDRGDLVADADITVIAPAAARSGGGADRYRLPTEGFYTWYAHLTADPSVDDELTLLVDAGPPTLVIFSPERGETFDGAPYVPLRGQVTDISGVDWLRVNGVNIPLAADGTFDYPWPAEHGLNLLWFEARDTLNRRVRVSRGPYYSPSWVPMDPPDMEVARLLDSVMLFLGQKGLDAGEREPGRIRDIATLIEVLLSAIDLPGLLGAHNTPLPIFSQVFEDVVDYSFELLGVRFGLSGDLILDVAVEEIVVGGFRVSGQYREGGVELSLGIGGATPDEAGLGVILSAQIAFDMRIGYYRPSNGDFVGLTLDPPPSLYAETAAFLHGIFFQISVDADMPRGGDLDIEVTDIRIAVEGVDLVPFHDLILSLGGFHLPFIGHVTLPDVPLTDLVRGLDRILTDSLIDPLIQWALDGLADLVSPLLSGLVTDVLVQIVDFLALDIEIPLPQLPGSSNAVRLRFSAEPSSVHMDPDGGTFGLGAGMLSQKGVDRDPHGSILRGGCLDEAVPEMVFDPETAMQVGLLFDFVNQVIFALWWGGGINLALDLDDLGGLGGIGGLGGLGNVEVNLDFFLPPIFTDCTPEGLTELQMGDLYLEISGSAMGLRAGLKAWVHVRAEAQITAEADRLGFTINRTPVIELEIIEATGLLQMFAGALPGLLRDVLLPMLVDGIGGALGAIPIPAIDLGGILPNVPPGTMLQLGNLRVETDRGYLVLGGDLL